VIPKLTDVRISQDLRGKDQRRQVPDLNTKKDLDGKIPKKIKEIAWVGLSYL